MSFWDTPFSTSCLHDFPDRQEDAMAYSIPDLDNASHSSSSLSTACFTNDNNDDSYASLNPLHPYPVLSTTRISVSPRVVDVSDSAINATIAAPAHLVDSGGNFNMTNSLDFLVNVVAIKPFDIGMAAQEKRSTSRCTHRGDFPLPMLDGSIFYTPMFYNPQASETILSPESICFHSNGILTSWSQSGSTLATQGSVSFFNQSGAEVLALTLQKRNGLYYTDISSFALDGDRPVSNTSQDYFVYFHEANDDVLDDISLDLDDSSVVNPADSPRPIRYWSPCSSHLYPHTQIKPFSY
jgi:hypothetical protein